MATDMTIKIDGIKGESKLKDHTDEIDLLAWSWGQSQSGTFGGGGGGGAGKVTAQDLSLQKYVDKSSPELLLACANGKHIKDAVLTVRKAGEKPLEYITITVEKILVTSISTGGSGGEDRLTESVTLNFAKMKIEYQEQDDTGSPKGGKVTYAWDYQQNVKP
jgi:type VI secretion system secreted protein Hcp